MTDLKVTGKDSDWAPKYLATLVGLFCGLYVITNAMNSKLFALGPITLPLGILLFPICTIITDVLTEVYGFNRARQAIWTVLICTVFYAIFTTIGIYLPSPAFWTNQDSYVAIFSTSWRMALAGCSAWLAGEFLNSLVVSKMKIAQNGNHMSLRFIGSTVIGQLADTGVFCLVAFAFIMPWSALLSTILCGWIFKVSYEILALPLSLPVTRWVKRLEGIEHFDHQKISVI